MRKPSIPAESVREQLRRIVESPQFSKSHRLKQFLEYVTGAALEERAGDLKESVLAIEVFERYEPREGEASSLVRVTASKVRAKLNEYYAAEGSADAVVIELPKGTYVPLFRERQQRPPGLWTSRWIKAAVVPIVVSLAFIAARAARKPSYATDPTTQDLYVKAVHFSEQFTGKGRGKGIQMLREVIQRDPRFAPAYVTLAETHLAPPSLRPPWEEASEARVLLVKALELAPESPEALTAMGGLQFEYDWNWGLAEQYFRRAIALNPSATRPRYRLGTLLAHSGRTDEALHELELALNLDPVLGQAFIGRTLANYLGRRFDQALEAAEKHLETHPNTWGGHLLLGVVNAGMGNGAEAITAFERLLELNKDPAPIGYLGALGHAYAIAGRRGDAERLLLHMETTAKDHWVSPVFMARVCVGLGRYEQALDLLDRAFEQHDPQMVWLKLDPRMDPLRDHARYQSLLQRLGF